MAAHLTRETVPSLLTVRGAQAITGSVASKTFYNVIVNKTAGQLLNTAGGTTSLTVNDLTETQGNFTAPATLTINGNFLHTAGTFIAGANIFIKEILPITERDLHRPRVS